MKERPAGSLPDSTPAAAQAPLACRLERFDTRNAAQTTALLTPGADAVVVIAHSGLQLRVAGFGPLAVNPNGALLLNPGECIALLGGADAGACGVILRLTPALAGRLARMTGVFHGGVDGTRVFPLPWCRTAAESYLALLRITREPHDAALALRAVNWLQALLRTAPAEWRRRTAPSRDADSAESRGFSLAQGIAVRLDARWRDGISLAELGAAFELSPFHLLRAFRRALGITPHQYTLQLRLRRALLPLETGSGRLADLARELGFSSHGHFSTAFRASFGLTPAEYAGARRAARSLKRVS
jgi:AraC-like DNA-binding protein